MGECGKAGGGSGSPPTGECGDSRRGSTPTTLRVPRPMGRNLAVFPVREQVLPQRGSAAIAGGGSTPTTLRVPRPHGAELCGVPSSRAGSPPTGEYGEAGGGSKTTSPCGYSSAGGELKKKNRGNGSFFVG